MSNVISLSDESIKMLTESLVTAMRMPEPYLSIEQVSQLTGIPVKSIYQNDMPRHKKYRSLLFKWSEVSAWIEDK
jgi:predicted DNA-binding transcriptional regulator AlpA